MKPQVICVPGGVAPAAQRYAPLKAAVGEVAVLHFKDLEVYREAAPPANYSIAQELEGIERFVDSIGLDRFHLVGYSGGGFISLAYAGTRPGKLLSLGLFEPAGVPGKPTTEEQHIISSLNEKVRGLDDRDFMSAFVREQLKPGVQPPPPPAGPISAEMQKRPAGIRAMMRAFDAYRFDRDWLKLPPFPVYLGYGDLTGSYESTKVAVLAQLFGDIRVQRFDGIHHFVPPEQLYTPAHAASLRELWLRAESRLVPELSL